MCMFFFSTGGRQNQNGHHSLVNIFYKHFFFSFYMIWLLRTAGNHGSLFFHGSGCGPLRRGRGCGIVLLMSLSLLLEHGGLDGRTEVAVRLVATWCGKSEAFERLVEARTTLDGVLLFCANYALLLLLLLLLVLLTLVLEIRWIDVATDVGLIKARGLISNYKDKSIVLSKWGSCVTLLVKELFTREEICITVS